MLRLIQWMDKEEDFRQEVAVQSGLHTLLKRQHVVPVTAF